MPFQVRPIAIDDVGAAARIVRAGSLTPESESVDEIDAYWSAVEETRACRGEVLVAEFDGEVVGVCQLMIMSHFQHTGGWCAEIESVYVRDDARGRGVGTRMLEFAEQLARQRGCYRLQLTSRNVREDAHRFYRRLGYAQTSQGFKKPLDGSDLA